MRGYSIPWVETQIGLSRRTAQRPIVDLYASDPKKRHVALFRITSEALLLLPAAKSKNEDKVLAPARHPGGKRRERSPVRPERIWQRASHGLSLRKGFAGPITRWWKTRTFATVAGLTVANGR